MKLKLREVKSTLQFQAIYQKQTETEARNPGDNFRTQNTEPFK
jgi:hypothetical protein